MKHWCGLLIVLAVCLILTGCGGSSGPATLRINNSMSFDAQDVEWRSFDFGPIASGFYTMREVSPGSDSIYIQIYGFWFRTVEVVTVNSGRQTVFTFYDSTLVYGPLNADKSQEYRLDDAVRSLPKKE